MNDYQELAASFGRVRSSWKRTAALSGFAIVVTEAIGIFTILLFLDWLYQPHTALRVGMWSIALVVAAWFFIKHVFGPLSRHIPDDQIAMYIEEHRADLDGVLITAAEYGQKREKIAGSQAELIDAVVRQASASASASIGHVVDLSRLKKYGIAAAAGIGLYFVLATLFPNAVGHHIGRILNPWHPTAEDMPKRPPGAVLLEPIKFTLSKGDASLARGTSYDFEATLSRHADKPVVLNFRPHAQGTEAPWQTLPMTEIEKLNGYQGSLADVSEDLEYYVACGGDKSETHRVTVFDPLVVQSLEVTTHYPAYVKLPDRVEKPSSGDVEALIGSTVTVRINASTPLKEGSLKWSNGQTQPMTVDTKANTGAIASFEVKEDGTYEYALTDTNGQQAAITASLSVKAIPDLPPTLEVKSPQSPVLTNPVGEVNFEIDSADDFGVEGVDLVYSRFDTDGKPTDTRIPLKLAAGDAKAGANAVHSIYKLMLEDANPPFKSEDAIPYHLEVRDAKGQKALSEIGIIVIGYFETWATWEVPHGPHSGVHEEGPDLTALLSMTWLLDGQKTKLTPADYQQQSKAIAAQMVEKSGALRDFIDLEKMPQLAKVRDVINKHAGKAEKALETADTQTAVIELSTAVALYAGNALLEDMALAKHAASSASGTAGSKPPALTMLEQARLDALSQGAKEAKDEENNADTKAAAAAGKQIEDLIKKQDEIAKNAKGAAGAKPEASKDAKGEKGAKEKQDAMAKAQGDLANKTKEAAEKAKAAAGSKAAGSKLGTAAQKTADAAKTMQAAAKDFAAGKNAEGAAKAEAAKKELQTAKESLQNTSRDKLEAAISAAAARAAALLEKQATLRKDTETSAKELDGGKTPDQRQKRDLEKQAYQETLLRADGELLKSDVDALNLQAAEVGQAEATRALADAQKIVKRSQPEVKMGNAVIDLNNSTPAPATDEQKKAEEALQKIVASLHNGSDALAASKEALLRRAQRSAAEAQKGLDQITGKKEGEKGAQKPDEKAGAQANAAAQAAAAKAGQKPGEQPGEKPGNKPGEQAKAGQKPGEQPEEKPGDKPGEQAAKAGQKPGEQPGEKPGAQPALEAKTGTTAESGGSKQEKIQKLTYDLQRLVANLDNRNIVPQKDIDQLKDLSADKAELEKRLAVDPKLLKDVSDIVARISDSLEAESQAASNANKMFSSQREECPPAYRQFVNQYFEALSQTGHASQPKTQPR